MFARLPFDEAAWLAEAGHSRAAAGESGFSTLERIWARPTAEVNGMWGGHTGPGGKTIIPAEAHAKLSFRLVAHQEPADVAAALREYVAQHTPPGIEATVTVDGPGVRPSFSPVDSPAVLAARRAMERAFGKEVLFTREGGSGPEADLAAILGAPLVFLAVGLDSDRIHAPNEKVEMPLLLKGAEAAAYLWDELAAARPSSRRRGERRRPQRAQRRARAAQPRAVPRPRWTGPRPAAATTSGWRRRGRTRAPGCSWSNDGQALVRFGGRRRRAGVRPARAGAGRDQVPARASTPTASCTSA